MSGIGRVWCVRGGVFHSSIEWVDDAGLAAVLSALPADQTVGESFRPIARFLLDATTPGSLSLVVPATDGLLVVVAGRGMARSAGSLGIEDFSGSSLAMWSNRMVALDSAWVVAGEDLASPIPDDLRFDLREGVVPAGGFALIGVGQEAGVNEELAGVAPPAPTEVQTSIPPPTVPAPAAFGVEPDSFGVAEDEVLPSSTNTLDGARLQQVIADGGGVWAPIADEPADELGSTISPDLFDRAADPVSPEPTDQTGAATTAPPAVGGPELLGVRCTIGHFNSTNWSTCRRCGESLADRPWERDVRPSLGVLRFDDGTSLQVDRNYLLGRRPGGTSWDGRDVVEPFTVDDGKGAVSKNHFEVIVREWDVRVLDRKSRNGTSVKRPDGGEVKLKPGVPLEVDIGDRVLFANRWMEFDGPAF